MTTEELILLSDEELCSLVKSGDPVSINVLIERYKGFITKTAREHFLNDGDFNDLFQEGLLGLLKAVYAFNGGAPFKNYCLKAIKNNIYSAIRKSNSDKNKPLINYVSLSGFSGEDGDDDKNLIAITTDEPLSDYLKAERLTELKDLIKKVLSDYEYGVLSDYLNGDSYAVIAEKNNCTIKSIDNAVQRIRKKIREKIKINRVK